MISINPSVRMANDMNSSRPIDTTPASGKDLIAGGMTLSQIRNELNLFLAENMDELVSTMTAKIQGKSGATSAQEIKQQAWLTAQKQGPDFVNDLKSQWNEKTSGLRDVANTINTILNLGDGAINNM